MSADAPEVKVVDAPETAEINTATEVAKDEKKAKPRSEKYMRARAQVDKTKLYDAFAAIEMIKRLSYSSFDGSIEAHAVLRETGASASFAYPHSTGQSLKVVIADDNVVKKIEAGNIDFDVLISTPEFMKNLTKHARVLGPKGLMPNPKTGTLTSNPEAKKAELEAGKITIKTEKKAPLIHTTLGKVSMDTKDLVENLQALTKAFKGKLLKLSIAASMSPSVKVEIE